MAFPGDDPRVGQHGEQGPSRPPQQPDRAAPPAAPEQGDRPGPSPYVHPPYVQAPFSQDPFEGGHHQDPRPPLPQDRDPWQHPYQQSPYQQGPHQQSPYQQGPYQQNLQHPQYSQHQQYPYSPQKSRVVAGVLGILLGGFGVHRFYLGHVGIGIIQVLMMTVGAVLTFGLSAIAVGIWGLIEGIMILVGTESFRRDARGVPLRD